MPKLPGLPRSPGFLVDESPIGRSDVHTRRLHFVEGARPIAWRDVNGADRIRDHRRAQAVFLESGLEGVKLGRKFHVKQGNFL